MPPLSNEFHIKCFPICKGLPVRMQVSNNTVSMTNAIRGILLSIPRLKLPIPISNDSDMKSRYKNQSDK